MGDLSWLPGLITGLGGSMVVLIVAVITTRGQRRQQRDQANTVAPPTTREVWDEVRELQIVIRSLVVLLGEVADQYPPNTKPVLSRRHVAIVAEHGYMPPEWEPKTDERG